MQRSTVFIVLTMLLGTIFSSSQQIAASYCDEWTSTQCKGRYRCINNQCILRYGCYKSQDCNIGYHCQEGKCIPNTQPPFAGRYCDRYTSCQTGYQCIQHKCIVDRCAGDYDCPVGFLCNGRDICGSDKQYGVAQGYCDQWTKCSSSQGIFRCQNNQCIPNSCYTNANCMFPYTCQMFKCLITK